MRAEAADAGLAIGDHADQVLRIERILGVSQVLDRAQRRADAAGEGRAVAGSTGGRREDLLAVVGIAGQRRRCPGRGGSGGERDGREADQQAHQQDGGRGGGQPAGLAQAHRAKS